MRLATIAN